MVIMVRIMASGQSMVLELYPNPQAIGSERAGFGLVWAFETSKSIPGGTPCPTRPHFLIFPKKFC